jgi:23S rRNA pseudouridine2605 synthase
MSEPTRTVRIQKYLAAQGVASRRAVEEMLIDGRITVNGRPAEGPPCFVDPETDDIRVDGKAVAARPARKTYFLLNKPKGVVCTQSDPEGRPRAVDLLPQAARRRGQRVYCAGRLDADTVGIILLTNDGELTELLTHPSHGVPKTYVVEVDGRVGPDEVARLRAGTWLDNKHTAPAGVKILRAGTMRSLLSIRLIEGRNREIRRLLAGLGHNVRRLKRVAIGPITDRGLKIGSVRPLSPPEVAKLRSAADTPPERQSRPKTGAKTPGTKGSRHKTQGAKGSRSKASRAKASRAGKTTHPKASGGGKTSHPNASGAKRVHPKASRPNASGGRSSNSKASRSKGSPGRSSDSKASRSRKKPGGRARNARGRGRPR